MSISNEKVISSAVIVVSEAMKGGPVPLCSIFAQLLLKNIRLEHDMKSLKQQMEAKPTDNSCKLEKDCDVIAKMENITTKLLKQSSLPKEGKLCTSLKPLSGCRCHSCKYAFLLKKKRKYKIKSKSEEISNLLYENDILWAVYRGITMCEILYIGHKNYKSTSILKKTQRRIVGATIRFPSEDVCEYFVPLQDLCFIKTSDYRTKQTCPNDSGYGAGMAHKFQVDVDLAITSGSSLTKIQNTKSNTNSSFPKDFQHLSPNSVCDNKKREKISAHVSSKRNTHSITYTGWQCQSIRSQNGCLEHRDLKIPCIEKRRCSLQDSSVTYTSKQCQSFQSQNRCHEHRDFKFPCIEKRRCSLQDSSTFPEFPSACSKTSWCDSAISLGSTDNSLRHCQSNQELCYYCLNLLQVRDHCDQHKILDSCSDCCFPCTCDKQNHNSQVQTDYCISCRSQFCLCKNKCQSMLH